jgi:2-polyprenyl-3-methyl-5-hydroxy-6-metoxy-1,4-benzoquinol methylase
VSDNAPAASSNGDVGRQYTFNPSPYGPHQKAIALVPAGARVLDVGCARGYISEQLVAKGCEVLGIELDREAADLARRHCAEVIVADMDTLAELPWPRQRFDVILCMDILEHLKDPARALKLLKPYLNPEGIIIVTLPNVANWWLRFRLLRGRWDYHTLGICDRSHLRFYTLKTARDLLAEAGLAITTFDVTPGAGAWAPYHYTIGKLLRLFSLDERFDYWLSRHFPGFFAYQFIFAARPQ